MNSDRMRMNEERTKSWLNSINSGSLDDLESVVESMAASSIIYSSSESESGEEQALGTRTNKITKLANQFSDDDDEGKYNDITELAKCKDVQNWDCIKNQVLNQFPQPSFSNISISNATNVVMGNIIKIRGDLILNVKNDTNNNKDEKENERVEKTQEADLRKAREVHPQSSSEVKIPRTKKTVYRPVCSIVPRSRWVAMDPDEEYNYIQEPVDMVVISHTATSSSNEQPENFGIIRDIQTFHIETRGWDDIAYNFLIGCDGSVFEGRGWGVEGAHTFGYNVKSIGISFIGCFMRKLPPARALEACKKLMQRGVEEGHLTPDYKLLTHRQCISTESPGKKLFEEIKTWEHFYDKEKEEENKLNET